MPEENASPQIDSSAAASAIDAAGGLGQLMSDESAGVAGEQQTVTPHQQTTPEQRAPAQQRDPISGKWVTAPDKQQAQQLTPQADSDGFTTVDPNSLAPELQQVYKSMQADYTRKTQEIAEQRKQFEQYGDPNSIEEAMQLYNTLQDPSAWPALHQELSQGLQAMGYTPQQAEQLAAQEVQNQQAQSTGIEGLDDEELAPVKQYVQGLEQKLANIEQQFQAQQVQQQQEQIRMALTGELQRQEQVIRQSNDTYTDDDINAIYELSSYYEGNLLDAQSRYEEIAQARLQRWLDQKQGAAQTATPLVSTLTQQQRPRAASLDEAHVQAMEALRLIEAQS